MILTFNKIIPAALLRIDVRGHEYKLTDLFRAYCNNLVNNPVAWIGVIVIDVVEVLKPWVCFTGKASRVC